MNVYTDVKEINKELSDLTSELSKLRFELSDARSFASGQHKSDVAAGFESQMSFGYSYAVGEESRLESLVSEKELELKIKEEELKSRLHFYFSDILVSAEYNRLTLASYLDKYSMISQWDEITQICIDRFGSGVFFELCCK